MNVASLESVVAGVGLSSIGKRALEGASLLPDGASVSVSGDMLVDTTNNILFSRVSRWQLDGPSPVTNQTISFPVVASLVYYDLVCRRTVISLYFYPARLSARPLTLRWNRACSVKELYMGCH
jgi:hypothetical protein